MAVRVPLVALVMLVAPLGLRAQCPDGSPPPCAPTARPTARPLNNVAVLYFENLSPDTSDAYLADGLTEEITARLGQIGRLSVTARAAVRRLRAGEARETADLGSTLGATYLVSGSVRRSGDRLRVTVELVRAATRSRVWGEQYDRRAADLLAIEEDIAEAVATGVAGRLLPTEQRTLAARPTRSPESYDHYLRGNRHLWREVQGGVGAAIAEYEAALRIDSGFTAARGRLALAYGLALNWAVPVQGIPGENMPAHAIAVAARAIREDSTVADAWLGRAFALFFSGKQEDLDAALESARHAVALNPADDAGHHFTAVLLRRVGRFAEAELEYHRALLINPGRIISLLDLAFISYCQRRYTESRSRFDSVLALDSTLSEPYADRALVRVEVGDFAGALLDAERGLRLATPSELPRAAAVLAHVEARNGQTGQARARLEGVFAELGWPNGVPTLGTSVRNVFPAAGAAVSLGEHDLAISILEQARPRGPWLWSYLIMPGFDALRDDARFIKIFEESKPPNAPDVAR